MVIPVDKDDTLPTQGIMVRALLKNVTGMSLCAKGMNLIIEADTRYTTILGDIRISPVIVVKEQSKYNNK